MNDNSLPRRRPAPAPTKPGQVFTYDSGGPPGGNAFSYSSPGCLPAVLADAAGVAPDLTMTADRP
jgi:hypothetical protein